MMIVRTIYVPRGGGIPCTKHVMRRPLRCENIIAYVIGRRKNNNYTAHVLCVCMCAGEECITCQSNMNYVVFRNRVRGRGVTQRPALCAIVLFNYLFVY